MTTFDFIQKSLRITQLLRKKQPKQFAARYALWWSAPHWRTRPAAHTSTQTRPPRRSGIATMNCTTMRVIRTMEILKLQFFKKNKKTAKSAPPGTSSTLIREFYVLFQVVLCCAVKSSIRIAPPGANAVQLTKHDLSTVMEFSVSPWKSLFSEFMTNFGITKFRTPPGPN